MAKITKGNEKIEKIKNKYLKQIYIVWFCYDGMIKIMFFADFIYLLVFVVLPHCFPSS